MGKANNIFHGFFAPNTKPAQPQAPIIAKDLLQLDARTRAENMAHRVAQQQNQGKPINEIGGPAGLEPTRYNDWEKAGRCIDF